MAYTNHAMHGQMICMFSTCATAISFFPPVGVGAPRYDGAPAAPHLCYGQTGLQRHTSAQAGRDCAYSFPEIFTLGLTSATTTFGNTVPTYDRERTLCDVIRQRGAMDVQTYQTAIREYMLHGHKNLRHLIQCSRALKVEDDVRRYLEVFLL